MTTHEFIVYYIISKIVSLIKLLKKGEHILLIAELRMCTMRKKLKKSYCYE